MKKILLIAFCFVSTLMASAQTSFGTAVDLQMGENSYDFGKKGIQTAYFKYTATFDQLLTLNYGYRERVYVRPDSASYTQLKAVESYDSIASTYTSIFPLKKDSSVYILVKIYTDSIASFTASCEETNLTGGDSCDDPRFMTDSVATYIYPGTYNYSSHEYSATYLQYTPAEDGVLSMEFAVRITGLEIMEDCGDTPTKIEAEEDETNGKYYAKYDVVANKSYIVAVHNAYQHFATFTLTHPTDGIADVKANAANVSNAVYDLQGRKVSTPNGSLSKGLYIINGKKVIE